MRSPRDKPIFWLRTTTQRKELRMPTKIFVNLPVEDLDRSKRTPRCCWR